MNSDCICGHPGLTYDGPAEDCPEHGRLALPARTELNDGSECGKCGWSADLHVNSGHEFRARAAEEPLSTRIARLARECPEHPWPLPKPSCPECARNAGIAAAARLAEEAS